MMKGLFDITKDNLSPYFCQACAVGKSDMSPDPRYCQGCYEFLKEETAMLIRSGSRSRPGWIPRGEITARKVIKVSGDMELIKATVKDQKSTVAIIKPLVAKTTLRKRGPKQKVLPHELITQWASEGMGYKRIAARLKGEHGIGIGFRTVARVVKGERLLV